MRVWFDLWFCCCLVAMVRDLRFGFSCVCVFILCGVLWRLGAECESLGWVGLRRGWLLCFRLCLVGNCYLLVDVYVGAGCLVWFGHLCLCCWLVFLFGCCKGFGVDYLVVSVDDCVGW